MNMIDYLFPYLFGYGMIGAWLPALLLSIAPGIHRRSVKVFFLSLLWVLVGITLPGYWFLLSVGLLPEWKGGCTLGAFTCFVVGKLWLSPLVVWALAAFYARVVWKVAQPLRSWIVFGYWVGAIVSVICLLHGIVAFPRYLMVFWPFLVPTLSAVYYSVVARRLIRESGISIAKLWAAAIATVPFWLLAFWQSRRVFESLPDQQPECFVVTAAMRGHASIVGPFHTIHRHGQERRVNRQLMAFWAFEAVWSARMPRLHGAVRMIYNRIGPLVAKRMTTAWIADAVYLALKPFEWALCLR